MNASLLDDEEDYNLPGSPRAGAGGADDADADGAAQGEDDADPDAYGKADPEAEGPPPTASQVPAPKHTRPCHAVCNGLCVLGDGRRGALSLVVRHGQRAPCTRAFAVVSESERNATLRMF